jgi:hypothetical protein
VVAGARLRSKQILIVILDTTITCPSCGTAKLETMATDACQFFYQCTGCGALLRPKPAHCCVFCSFGSVPCPPIQEAGGKNRCSDTSPAYGREFLGYC